MAVHFFKKFRAFGPEKRHEPSQIQVQQAPIMPNNIRDDIRKWTETVLKNSCLLQGDIYFSVKLFPYNIFV
jgi:hypothetical protein